jgi:MoxR-like ATPase
MFLVQSTRLANALSNVNIIFKNDANHFWLHLQYYIHRGVRLLNGILINSLGLNPVVWIAGVYQMGHRHAGTRGVFEMADSVRTFTNVPDADLAAVKQLADAYKTMSQELGKVIVGQTEVVEQVLTAMFCQGHVLLVGVPGLAKTLLVKTISDVLHLPFKRIQFTPDLMPSDITGTEVIEEDRTTGKRVFRFVRGPIFANMVLADEINRTPPKTQAALLEAMQEHRVTNGETSYDLPEPFFVLATQNPIEQEGTYPLPEAQLDRFMFQTLVRYPTAADEIQIMKQATSGYKAELSRLLDGETILKLQQIVRRVPVAEHVYVYARDLVRATRPGEPGVPAFVNELVQWGAGPRASIYLILAGKARAILHGRVHVTTEDIASVAHPVLRHRILTTFSAEAAGMNSDKLIDRLIKEIPRSVK